jgi:CheY-like chemotaxis protein
VSLDGMRVLIADDNRSNRELVRAMLTSAGAEVTEAVDGMSAFVEARSMPYDAILMDIRMPGQDGPATAKIIRERDGPNQFTPILAFSADVEVGAFDTRHFDGVVQKPLAASALFAELTRWCGGEAITLGASDAVR